MSRSVEIGPLISDRQRNRVASIVERALGTGHMEITVGGKVRAGADGRLADRDLSHRRSAPAAVEIALDRSLPVEAQRSRRSWLLQPDDPV